VIMECPARAATRAGRADPSERADMTTLNRRGVAVSRYDLRYAAKHPLVWLRFWWVHLTVCGMFVTLAVVWTHPLYSRVLGPPLWPIAAGGLAAANTSTERPPDVDLDARLGR
jgi:hypothetical protein